MPPVARTVGFCVFAITHGMKLSYPRRFLPWVFAFLPLPTVENRCQARRPYRGFLHFRHYPRYAASRAYRGFLRFRHYQRYEIELSPPIPTVGFRVFAVTHGMPPVARTVGFHVFAITNGMKLGCPCRFLPWVFALSALPTVCRRSRIPWVFAFSLLPTV